MGGITFGGMVKSPLVAAPEAATEPDPPADPPLLGAVEPLVVELVEPVLTAVAELPDVPSSPLAAIPELGAPLVGWPLAPLEPTDDEPDVELSEPVEALEPPAPNEHAVVAHAHERITA